MKNILVATDFSQNANAAVLFACRLAANQGARLILFHAYHPGILLEEVSIWADQGLLEQEVQARMDQLAKDLHATYAVSITRLLKPGFAADEILPVAQKVKADLVLLGCRGAGNHRGRPLGKVATEVLKKSNLPLICVPPEPGEATATQPSASLPNKIIANEAGKTMLCQMGDQIPV